MKKFYHTLAIAAVAAVSLFSAQQAKAQTENVSDENIATEYRWADADVEESSVEDLRKSIKAYFFLEFLKSYHEDKTVYTKERVQEILKLGQKVGLTVEEMMPYLTTADSE